MIRVILEIVELAPERLAMRATTRRMGKVSPLEELAETILNQAIVTEMQKILKAGDSGTMVRRVRVKE